MLFFLNSHDVVARVLQNVHWHCPKRILTNCIQALFTIINIIFTGRFLGFCGLFAQSIP